MHSEHPAQYPLVITPYVGQHTERLGHSLELGEHFEPYGTILNLMGDLVWYTTGSPLNVTRLYRHLLITFITALSKTLGGSDFVIFASITLPSIPIFTATTTSPQISFLLASNGYWGIELEGVISYTPFNDMKGTSGNIASSAFVLSVG